MHGPDDGILDRGPYAMTVDVDGLPGAHRDQYGREPCHHIADGHLYAEHLEVGHRVGGSLRPASGGGKFLAPRLLTRLSHLSLLRHHRHVVVPTRDLS